MSTKKQFRSKKKRIYSKKKYIGGTPELSSNSSFEVSPSGQDVKKTKMSNVQVYDRLFKKTYRLYSINEFLHSNYTDNYICTFDKVTGDISKPDKFREPLLIAGKGINFNEIAIPYTSQFGVATALQKPYSVLEKLYERPSEKRCKLLKQADLKGNVLLYKNITLRECWGDRLQDYVFYKGVHVGEVEEFYIERHEETITAYLKFNLEETIFDDDSLAVKEEQKRPAS